MLICLGLARKGNWHAIPNWGDWEGRERWSVDAKSVRVYQPWGLLAYGSGFIGDYMPGFDYAYPQLNFGL